MARKDKVFGNFGGMNIRTGSGVSAPYAGRPDSCPIYHHAIEALQAGGGGYSDDPTAPDTVLTIVYRCPRHACGSFFVALYKRISEQPDSTHTFPCIPFFLVSYSHR